MTRSSRLVHPASGGLGHPLKGVYPLEGHQGPQSRSLDTGPPTLVPEGVHAILAIDPGGTTGVAGGYYELKRSIRKTLTEGCRMHKTSEVGGHWLDQAEELATIVNRFRYTAHVEQQLPSAHVHLVWENYTRRPAATDNDLHAVYVTAAACAQLAREVYVGITWQEPSEAKGYATNERLHNWGLWVRGSEHMRDANRHLARKLDRLLAV